MSRAASASTTGALTPSAAKVWCDKKFLSVVVRDPPDSKPPKRTEKPNLTGRHVVVRALSVAAECYGWGVANKEEKIEFEGEVIEALSNGKYRIALDNGHETMGYLAGKMRRFRIRILPGDRIKIELSPYDLNRGRIVYRHW
jgi:translation initiation factor IF-1